VGVPTGLIGLNEIVKWRAKHLGIHQHLTRRLQPSNIPTTSKTMIEEAFKFMQHDHFFIALSENQTVMKDRFTFAAGLSCRRVPSRVIGFPF